MTVEIEVEFDLEEDGRWIAEAVDFPGVLAYGLTQEEARAEAATLASVVRAEKNPVQ